MVPPKRRRMSTSSPLASGYETSEGRTPQPAHAHRVLSASVADLNAVPEAEPDGAQSSQPGHTCSTNVREMDDLNAGLCEIPVDLRALVLSHIEQVKTRQILALSSTFREAFSLPGALPQIYDFEGVAGDVIADRLVRLLDVRSRVRSLDKERVLELMGDERNRLCQYACGRNFEVLKWAHNEVDLPWAPYPAGRVSDDVLVLRVLRETSSALKGRWPEGAGHVEWRGLKMVADRVDELVLEWIGLTGGVPAEVWRLSALRELSLAGDQLTSVPAEIGQLTSLTELNLRCNQLTSVPAEIWQLASLTSLHLDHNQLTSVPADIGQLASLRELELQGNQLTSVPAEIGQLTSLKWLNLGDNQLTSVPAEIGRLTSLRKLYLDHNQLTSVPAEIGQLAALIKLYLNYNQLTSVPAEIGEITSLQELWLNNNRLTSVPAEIGQLTSLEMLLLHGNQLTSVPAAIRDLRAAGNYVKLDNGVTVDE